MSISTERAAWGSRLGFIFAAVGSAVGLGAIWKFPYVMGQNGGGAFLLVYLGCVMLIGIALWLISLAVFALSIPNALSFGVWSAPLLGDKTFFDIMDYVAVNILMPAGGFAVAFFVGWVIWPKVKLELAAECNPLWQQVFRWICAVLAPVVIAVIWYTNL